MSAIMGQGFYMVRWAKNPSSCNIDSYNMNHIIPQYIEVVIPCYIPCYITCYISFCLGSDESSYPEGWHSMKWLRDAFIQYKFIDWKSVIESVVVPIKSKF